MPDKAILIDDDRQVPNQQGVAWSEVDLANCWKNVELGLYEYRGHRRINDTLYHMFWLVPAPRHRKAGNAE